MFAGIDYLTLWSRSSDEANKSFYNSASDWVAGVGVGLKGLKSATLYGTKGYRNEGAYIGIGNDCALLNVPGPLAQQGYEAFYNSSHDVTRLDIQVTCSNGYNPSEPLEPFKRYLERLESFKPTSKGRKAIPSFTGKGETLTIYSGARASPSMGRIYDKWQQSNEAMYKNCIRWEVQLRRGNAQYLADKWLMNTSDEITSDIPGLIASFWQKRGLIVPFNYVHKQLWQQPPIQAYDYERTLRWLTVAVAPAIERLTGYVSRTQIMLALGLDLEGIEAYNAAMVEASVVSTEDMV